MGGDIRNANPEQLEELADRLESLDGRSGVAARLQELFNRAATLDASAELSSLHALQTWASETAAELRDRAAAIRGDDVVAPLTASALHAGSLFGLFGPDRNAIRSVSGGGGLGDDGTGEESPHDEENDGGGREPMIRGQRNLLFSGISRTR